MEFASAPAYTSLRTIASIVPLGEGSKPLTESGPAFSVAGPIGPANIALGLRKVSISDDNQRTEKQAYVGLPLNTALSLVYWGSGIDFAKPSPLYWSPQGYASNSVGLELAARQLRGWSLLMRALPGMALTTEQPFVHNAVADTTEAKWRFQFATGGELAYRKPGWESGIGFDWGRVANYTRTSLNFRVTLVR